jgi:hypothetical protein
VANNKSFFDNDDFQDALVNLLVVDAAALRTCFPLLKSDDFKPIAASPWGRPRWLVAERALHFFQNHSQPAGKLLQADIIDYAAQIGMSDRQSKEILDYLVHLRKVRCPAPDAVIEKVVRYKRERIKAAALQELNELHSTGQLTDEKWSEINSRVLAAGVSQHLSDDYLSTMAHRSQRRRYGHARPAIPVTFIEPLDAIVGQYVGPAEIGLILAPYKRGKSAMLQWLTISFCLQHLDVLFITLENPKHVVEDRLDSITSQVPIAKLAEMPNTVERRFARWRNMIKARLNVYDGVGERMTVADIEKLLLSERNRGFRPKVLVIDYDDKLHPSRHLKERRFEIESVYDDLLNLGAKYQLIVWTAAQTQRDTSHLKVLSGDRCAEDIGKLRNVTMGISMGKGDWDSTSIYLWIAAHRNSAMELGCEIIPDLKRTLVYDREATRRASLEHQPDEN